MLDYAVIFTYSFDDECSVFLFVSEREAVDFLRKSFDEECRIDKKENGWDSECEISEDGWKAKIVNHFDDRDDITNFQIGIIKTA